MPVPASRVHAIDNSSRASLTQQVGQFSNVRGNVLPHPSSATSPLIDERAQAANLLITRLMGCHDFLIRHHPLRATNQATVTDHG
jgi:hypothetical protein